MSSLTGEENAQVAQVAEAILEGMILDMALTLSIAGHRDIKIGASICYRCGTRCRDKSQLPPPSALVSSSNQSSTNQAGNGSLAANHGQSGNKSRSSTPQLGENGNGTAGTSKNGTIHLPCLDCGRMIASNRYAPHLAGCLGLAGGQRRTARANANGSTKSRLGSERSTPSVYVDADSDGTSDASGPTYAGEVMEKPAGKPGRKPGRPPKNPNAKRAGTPTLKGMSKKQKLASNLSAPHPLTQSATFSDSPLTPTFSLKSGSHSKHSPLHSTFPKQRPKFSQSQETATNASMDEDAEGEVEDDVEVDLAVDEDGEDDEEYVASHGGDDSDEFGVAMDDDFA